jgi:hypothetical protein
MLHDFVEAKYVLRVLAVSLQNLPRRRENAKIRQESIMQFLAL